MPRHTSEFPWCSPIRAGAGIDERFHADGTAWVRIDAAEGLNLNPSATVVWLCCREGMRPADMVTRLLDMAPDAGEVLVDDIQHTLQRFLKSGLIEPPAPVVGVPGDDPVPVEIISLKRDSRRREHVTTQLVPRLRRSVTRSFDVGVFDAVDGIDQAQVDAALSRLGVTVSPGFSDVATGGQIACYLSHLSVMHGIIHGSGAPTVIMEDDASLAEFDFGCRLQPILDELRDIRWDIVYLYMYDHHYNAHAHDTSLAIPGKQHLVRPYYSWCSLAYLVNVSGASKILTASRTLTRAVDERVQEMIAAGELEAFYARRQCVLNLGQKTSHEPARADEFPSNVSSAGD
jgi:GR25 family glycosyltransferase involved in LPS biosynthesis